MTCTDVRIEDFLLGFLDAGEAAEVERHLASCSVCAAERDRVRALLDRLEELPMREADAAPVAAAVLARTRKKRKLTWEVLLMPTAASVLFGVIAFIALVPQQPATTAKQDAPHAKEIDKLVEKLSDADVAERDKAEKAIVDLAKDLSHAFIALEKAKKSGDAEVVARAERAAKALRDAIAALATASKSDDAAERMAALDKRIVDNPKDPTAWLERARLRLEQKKWQDAIADCTRAIELDPMLAEAFLARATAREGLEDLAGAIEDKNRVRIIEEMRARMDERPK